MTWALVSGLVSLVILVVLVAGVLALGKAGLRMIRDDDAEDDDREEGDIDPEPVPDSDPQHIDPAGDLADAVVSGDLDLSLADDQDAEELREFVEAVESGELGPVDPGLEAQVRIARALLARSHLDDLDGDGEEGDS